MPTKIRPGVRSGVRLSVRSGVCPSGLKVGAQQASSVKIKGYGMLKSNPRDMKCNTSNALSGLLDLVYSRQYQK